ncbi:7-carboxy-7-deazaguanine synthase [Salinicola endophyticus]|uniref:7-carboxy-7-deazaguanine synthase n=1 Tax=Salinicola endophyticus TaxID=1949083 RepID=A0ABY8FNJ8_9GAMM|nr:MULTISPECIES: 7-carboxy-7-deazaguanine synthase [Salinicola]WFF42771.1 7-carboxy-7-deazaguanine synthase [Salinicola endophyticus]
MYSVKEAFYTLQGEGAQSGRASVFCRFTGCNLWSGREVDRARAQCTFCDTDFIGTDGQNGGRFADAEALATHLAALWQSTSNSAGARRYVVFTGGEPLLQLDPPLLEAMHARDFEIAVETNGTLPVPSDVDWICVSPKGDNALIQTRGDELKLVHPQPGVDPQRFSGLDFTHFFLQPIDPAPGRIATDRAPMASVVDYCLRHPQWRLSLQTHKIAGID